MSVEAVSFGHVLNRPGSFRSTTRIGKVLLLLSVLSLGVALLTRVYFAWGAFEFEGSTSFAGPTARWLGPRSSIPVYGPQRLWVFGTDVLSQAGKIHLIPPAGEPVTLDVAQNDQAYLPMFSKMRLWPSRHGIAFEKSFDDATRQISGKIVYPPILMTVPLLMTRGADKPRQTSQGTSIVCFRQCVLAVLHDRLESSSVSLELEVFSSGGESEGQSVEVSALASYFDELQVSLNSTAARFAEGKVVVSANAPPQKIDFEVRAPTRWYKLHIRSSLVRSPAGSWADVSGDVLKPALRILVTERPKG